MPAHSRRRASFRMLVAVDCKNAPFARVEASIVTNATSTPEFPTRRRLNLLLTLLLGLSALAVLVYSWDRLAARLHAQFPGLPDRSLRFDKLLVPRAEVLPGGVPMDGIPAINRPAMLSAEEARYLRPGDRVIGVKLSDKARAYPLKVLAQHEIVNDQIADLPVAVTYCPLCDSAALFDRRVGDKTYEFGVSGLLYNSNVLMYDRDEQGGGLWSQLMAQGISGATSGASLKPLPLELTTWSDCRGRHPQTQVLAVEANSERRYDNDPYRNYFASPNLMFPARPLSSRLPAKQRVLGVWTDKAAKAYPLSALAKFDRPLGERIEGKKFTISFDPKAKSARIEQADDGVQWAYSFWFAWYAFHPKTEVFALTEGRSPR